MLERTKRQGPIMDIGAELRTAREAKGLSIAALAERTRVPARTLSAIERNDRSALPPQPFARGFVRTYADELDLDHERVVREYFAQFPAEAPTGPLLVPRDIPDPSWSSWSSRQPPSRWLGMGTAVAILLVVVTAAVVLGRRSERDVEPGTVGTTGGAPAAPAAAPTPDAPLQPAARPTDPRPTAVPSAPISVVMSMSRPCWVSATVDRRRAIYRILEAGARETLSAERDIAIRFGDAGAVTWTINGRDPGPLGAAGAVRDVRITVENAGTVR
jgi:cytoskeleton protein RodZ